MADLYEMETKSVTIDEWSYEMNPREMALYSAEWIPLGGIPKLASSKELVIRLALMAYDLKLIALWKQSKQPITVDHWVHWWNDHHPQNPVTSKHLSELFAFHARMLCDPQNYWRFVETRGAVVRPPALLNPPSLNPRR